MRFKQILPASLAVIGVVMAGSFSPAQAESRTAPTLKISCVSSKAIDVSCSWTGIPPGFFTRWALLRSDGRAFFTPASQTSFIDTLVKSGGTYSYLVWAYNEAVGVARSDTATVLVFGPDAVPTTLAPLESPPKVVIKSTGDAPTTTVEPAKQELVVISTETSKPPVATTTTAATTQPPVTDPGKSEPTTAPQRAQPTRRPAATPVPVLAPEPTRASTSILITAPTTLLAPVTSSLTTLVTTPDTKPTDKTDSTRPPVTTVTAVAPKKPSKDAKRKLVALKGMNKEIAPK